MRRDRRKLAHFCTNFWHTDETFWGAVPRFLIRESQQREFRHFGHDTTRERAGIITGMGEPCLLHLRGVFDVKSGACPTTTGTCFSTKKYLQANCRSVAPQWILVADHPLRLTACKSRSPEHCCGVAAKFRGLSSDRMHLQIAPTQNLLM